MDPLQTFIAELVILAVIVIVLVLRCWAIRHQRRGLEDWIRDIYFTSSALLCMATTSCLAWYCWMSIEVYRQATITIDEIMAESPRNSTIDLTATEAAALQSKIATERDFNIELLATALLLSPWYRRFLFFMWGSYFTTLWLLKGAFLAFYWSLFSRVHTRFVYLLYGTSILVVITYIIVLTIHFAWCIPVQRNWSMPLSEFPGTSSIDSVTTLTVGSFLNIGTELMILILPLLIVRSLNLRRRDKYALCFNFLVGVMCIAASLVRYVKMYYPYDHPPATMQGVRVTFLWSSLEMMTGFLAFCLPSFRPVVFRAIKRGKDFILNKGHSAGLPGVANDRPSTAYSNPKRSSSVSHAKKNLPRHPNTLLTADFVTLNTISGGEELRQLDIILHPPNALTREGNGTQPKGHNNYVPTPNDIHVTNSFSVRTRTAEGRDISKHESLPYSFSSPSAAPHPAGEEHGEKYAPMPMQREYACSMTQSGSTDTLRPASKDKR